jgi:hypothetical protein
MSRAAADVAARHQGHELVGFRLVSAPEPRELVHPILDDARDAAIGEPLVATIALSGPLPRCLRCSRLARQLDA